MLRYTLLFTSILFSYSCLNAQERIAFGMKITHTVKFKKSVYKLDGMKSQEQPVLLVEGENITIDFNNSLLQGSNSRQNPDEFFGIAIIVQNSRNVTIKNLKAKGYKIALLARNSQNLSVDNCDFSYNYRQRLNSTQEKEDISDWLSYHHNEKDEWLRYGAAIYLRQCNNATITNCKVTGGQNALLMTECNDGLIYNNDFSFNSGLGIGMYQSNRNKIMYNRIIFNVRGYSDGVYNRGQDSAAILVYEQSSNNLFFKNNVTHSGDGFFLWAGQTTMDKGTGGCNDNVIIGNDFSYAPTNGIEVTFSRNTIVDNRIYECDHGIWGGYSYETNISNNKFRNNRVAIAIEHGQENKITYNVFYRDKEAIRLWGNKEEPSDWGYPKYRDTRSKQYVLASNSVNMVPIAFNIRQTENIEVFSNSFIDCNQVFKIDSTVTGLDTTFKSDLSEKIYIDTSFIIPFVKNPNNPFKGANELAGRKNILITEWGPYDFRSPVIWNTNPTDTGDVMKFEILGPKGKWKIKSYSGVDNFSSLSGGFPSTITAQKIKSERTDIKIELVYNGQAITTAFGEAIKSGKSYPFHFKKFFQPMDWNISWYGFDSVTNPITHHYLFPPNTKPEPFRTEKAEKLDYAWWGGLKAVDGRQYNQFITVADARTNVPEGKYELGVTWDDAVRVYVDDKLLIDQWDPSLYNFDTAPHKTVQVKMGGNHHFRVEHVELGGFSTLSLKLKRIE